MPIVLQRHVGARDALCPGQFCTDVLRHRPGEMATVYVCCPSCGGIDALPPDHVVERPSGRVVPAWKCPTATCVLFELVTLEGWGATDMSEVRTPPKRLAELNPKWITVHGTGEVYGIRYDCPCGAADCEMGGWCTVPTKSNFIGKPTSADSARRGWDITGSSFDDITLSPSIHHVGHWHGFLRNGVLESC